MSELRRNIVTNFKRYTDGKNRVEYIVKIAIYTTLSYILYVVAKFPLPFLFPNFLDIQISELPALIAGFSMGPISGVLVIFFKCLLKLPLSGTFFVGEATDVILGICFVVPSSLIYNSKKNKKTALLGLVVGSLTVTVMSIIVNRFISIPFYVEVMFKGSWAPLLGMMSKLYKGITKETFYKWYLGVGILPFNLLRCFIVSAVTYFLYPRLKRPLKLETMEVYNDKYTPVDPEASTDDAVDTIEKDGVYTVTDEENDGKDNENVDNIADNAESTDNPDNDETAKTDEKDDDIVQNDDKDLANNDEK